MHFETVCNGRSTSSKVIDFGTNGKRACNFLLVIIINLGPIFFASFQRYYVFSAQNSDCTPIPPEFWGVSFGQDCRCCGTEEQTDERTNGRLIAAIPRCAHGALRGKNRVLY